jgi:tetratricopeptide (TPR) repeat protein
VRQHSWWFWIVIISASTAVIIVVSLIVFRLPEAWQRLAFLAAAAIGAALSFWADVGSIRSWLQGDRVAKQLVAEQEKTLAAVEALPERIREETTAILSDFIDGRAEKALEITIATEDKFIQEQQEMLRAGRVDEVIKVVEKYRVERVAEYSGLLARAYLQKGDIDFHAGRFDRAEQLYRVSLREAQSSGEKEIVAECYFELGAAVAMQGEYPEAEQYSTETIRLKPDLAEAYYNRGVAYDAQGECDLAIADYDKAIELGLVFAEAYVNRGAAYYHNGEYDPAIADYDRAIELKPNSTAAYYNRGLAYAYKGKHDLAIADYDRAIELGLVFAEVYNNRGLAYYYKGEYDLAIADYHRAIRLKPDSAESHLLRGLAHKKWDEKKAITDFERFLQLSEDENLRKGAEEQLRELRGE